MNSTNASLDYWFGLYGYAYITDIITAYLITPAWLVSLLFSILSLFILLKTPFLPSSFFRYMRLYVANCLILSAVSTTTIISLTRRITSITNTYEAVFYAIYVHWFITNSLNLFGNCIEICLVVERSLYILPKSFHRIKLLSFKKFFFILFLACSLVNTSGLVLFHPACADIQMDENKLFRIWYFSPASFSYTRTGRIVNYLGYLFREILPMVLNLVLNSISICLVRRYVENKNRIVRTATESTASFDQRLTYISVVMSTLSLLEHVVNVASYVLFFIKKYGQSTKFIGFALLVIAVKHSLVFFILLFFNGLFRNEVKKIFKKVH